ncbi:hypothetical protein BDW22DRAFT_1432890 [Trametopsis cervina]|nr:hypothetical protein BDW22DRAFT_1432890 [Trametopsis cervina]
MRTPPTETPPMTLPLPLPLPAFSPRDRTRDKALLISIEYKRFPHDDVPKLDTAHADLERVYTHLVQHWGYLEENITVLRDDHLDTHLVPTRDHIFREIDSLVEDVQPGDRRVFFSFLPFPFPSVSSPLPVVPVQTIPSRWSLYKYNRTISSISAYSTVAGHCYQIKNRRGTEWDNLDEVILTAKHSGPPDPAEDYPFTHKVRRGLVVDNELRERLVNCIPCGAKLVAIADTCHSGTLFDLTWHWHCDSRDSTRLITLPSPPLALPYPGARRPPTPARRSTKIQIHGAAQEYAYRSDAYDSPQHHHHHPQQQQQQQRSQPHERKFHGQQQHAGGRASTGPKRVKTLFSRANTPFTSVPVPSETPPTSTSEGFADMGFAQCASPTQEIEPDVVALASAKEDQSAWSGSAKDTMTSFLVELLEELGPKRIPAKELTHRLNHYLLLTSSALAHPVHPSSLKMRGARRQTMEALYKSKHFVFGPEETTVLNKIQVPQVRPSSSSFIREALG